MTLNYLSKLSKKYTGNFLLDFLLMELVKPSPNSILFSYITKNYILIICMYLTFFSCSSGKNKIEVSVFPEITEVYSAELKTEGIVFDPTDIIILENTFVIKDDKSSDLLHFFDVNNHLHVGSFIGRGRGPNEEIFIQQIKGISENKFLYKGLGSVKLVEYDKQTNKLIILEEYVVPMDALIVAFPLSKEKVLGWNYTNHPQEFLLYNTLNEKFTDFGNGFFIPDVILNNEENHRIFGNKQITVKPDGKLFATAYMALPLVRIFDIVDGSLANELITSKSESFPFALINRNSTKDEIKKLVENYYKIVSNDNYIYALYSGKTKGELYPDLFSPNFGPPDFGNEIHVFDWSGKTVKKIILDKMIYSFDVSSDNSLLIAITRSHPDKVLLYKMSPF